MHHTKFRQRFVNLCKALTLNSQCYDGQWYWNQRDPNNKGVSFCNGDILTELRRKSVIETVTPEQLPVELQEKWKYYDYYVGQKNDLVRIVDMNILERWSQECPFTSLAKMKEDQSYRP